MYEPDIVASLAFQLADGDIAEQLMRLAEKVNPVAVTADSRWGNRVEVRYNNGSWSFTYGKKYQG